MPSTRFAAVCAAALLIAAIAVRFDVVARDVGALMLLVLPAVAVMSRAACRRQGAAQ
ncbi:hypothetical protein [Novosphingobium aquimarinum]|uniref:hypothetical protein n=1 Tax=Novosphingobium aquimarinum TaxID=2682494 RepID=UPI0012EC3C0A|nr:hypothetical protein [Novosphingobium aquimarinum]